MESSERKNKQPQELSSQKSVSTSPQLDLDDSPIQSEYRMPSFFSDLPHSYTADNDREAISSFDRYKHLTDDQLGEEIWLLQREQTTRRISRQIADEVRQMDRVQSDDELLKIVKDALDRSVQDQSHEAAPSSAQHILQSEKAIRNSSVQPSIRPNRTPRRKLEQSHCSPLRHQAKTRPPNRNSQQAPMLDDPGPTSLERGQSPDYRSSTAPNPKTCRLCHTRFHTGQAFWHHLRDCQNTHSFRYSENRH